MAQRMDMTTLVVNDAFAAEFKTGSRGFRGKLLDPQTGKRYQVTAVEIHSGNGKSKGKDKS